MTSATKTETKTDTETEIKTGIKAGIKAGKAGTLISYGVYNIRNINTSGMYVNVDGSSKTNGTNIQLWNNPQHTDCQFVVIPMLGNNNVYVVRSTTSGLVLNVPGGGQVSGMNVQTWDNPTSPGSQWHIVNVKFGIFTLQNASSGLYLNCSKGGIKIGTNIQIWVNPSAASQWSFEPVMQQMVKGIAVKEGLYNIQSVNAPSMYAHVSGGKNRNGTNIVLWNNPESQFVIEKIRGWRNLYNIRFSTGEHYVNTSASAVSNGGNIYLWDNPGSYDSRFYFDLVDEESMHMRVVIRNIRSNLFLSCEGAGVENGTNVLQWCDPQHKQTQWLLVPVNE